MQANRLTQVFPTKIVTFTEDNRLSPLSLCQDVSVSVKAWEVINRFQSLKNDKVVLESYSTRNSQIEKSLLTRDTAFKLFKLK